MAKKLFTSGHTICGVSGTTTTAPVEKHTRGVPVFNDQS